MSSSTAAAADPSVAAAQVRRRSAQQSSFSSTSDLPSSKMPYEPPLPHSSLASPGPEIELDSHGFTSRPAKAPSRTYLRLQAIMWRFLMAIGMYLHRLAPPRPRKHAFVRSIPTTVSPTPGNINLYFYTPKNYNRARTTGKESTRYPVVVNFHGGGFTIGHPCDDAKWADTVVNDVDAVCVCVEYRLAPEHPFPTAVEDGVDAILYLAQHAEALDLDPARIAVSGFSCGGNLAFTVPLRLHEELDHRAGAAASRLHSYVDMDSATDSTGNLLPPTPASKTPNVTATRELPSSADSTSLSSSPRTLPKPLALVSWYPSADYTLTRAQRRETCTRADMELSPMFTALFDAAYLPPDMDKAHRFLSPARAPAPLLSHALPDTILLYTCEWDVLRGEAQSLHARLLDCGKRSLLTMVPAVPHGWDRSPNPLREAPGLREHYRAACRGLRGAFYGRDEAQGPARASSSASAAGGL